MVATGLCHSDLSVINGVMEFSNKFPQVPGHEGAGIVESVGEKVTKFKPGDHVIPLYAGQCLKCDFCKSGKTNTCEVSIKMQEGTAMIDGTSRLRCKGKMLYQFMSCGTFSEYTVVEDIALAKVSLLHPPPLTTDQESMINPDFSHQSLETSALNQSSSKFFINHPLFAPYLSLNCIY